MVEFKRTENSLKVRTQHEILGLCRSGLIRLEFYRTKFWDMSSNEHSIMISRSIMGGGLEWGPTRCPAHVKQGTRIVPEARTFSHIFFKNILSGLPVVRTGFPTRNPRGFPCTRCSLLRRGMQQSRIIQQLALLVMV